MKKAVFFSLTAIILVGFAIFYFNIKTSASRLDDDFSIERLQLSILDNFVKDFDTLYIEQILGSSAKNAIVGRSKDTIMTKSELAVIMKNGNGYMDNSQTSTSLLNQALRTLTFDANPSFDFVLNDVTQLTYDRIKLSFHINYSFLAFDSNWTKKNKPLNLTLDVYGFWHPAHADIIDDSWLFNATGCYANDIISDLSSCNGLNIMPQ